MPLRLLRRPLRWKNDSDRTLGVEFEFLDFDPDARALYVAFANAIEAELKPTGSLATVKAFASKLPEHSARMAGVLALTEDPDTRAIDANALANGIELAKYYLAEAMRLSAAGAVDPGLHRAETLRQWLMAQPSNVVGLRQIYQFGPAPIRDAATARSAMKELESHGWAIPIAEGTIIDGTTCKEAWRIIKC